MWGISSESALRCIGSKRWWNSSRAKNRALVLVSTWTSAKLWPYAKQLQFIHSPRDIILLDLHVSLRVHFCPAAVCLPPEPPANGRMLGRVFRVGHEVHFLCSPGFRLTGAETRVCLDSLTWSGEQAACKGTTYQLITCTLVLINI